MFVLVIHSTSFCIRQFNHQKRMFFSNSPDCFCLDIIEKYDPIFGVKLLVVLFLWSDFIHYVAEVQKCILNILQRCGYYNFTRDKLMNLVFNFVRCLYIFRFMVWVGVLIIFFHLLTEFASYLTLLNKLKL